MPGYSKNHAKSGVAVRMPAIESFASQYSNYEITIIIPEFTSVCPKTKLPDFGEITIKYMPDKKCVELKSLKLYTLAYRNLGIFYENVINKMLGDFTKAIQPKWAVIRGEFTPRGGIRSVVEAKYGNPRA